MSSTESARESRVRRALAREGLRLWKVRQGRHFWELGPYAVVDIATNSVGQRGVDLAHLEQDYAVTV